MQPDSRFPAFHIFAVAIAAGSLVMLLRASDHSAAAPEPIAHALEGVWVCVGVPDDVSPAPRSGGRLKFRISNHWTFTQADPATGAVKAHFGGTYRLHADEYIETIDYSTDPDDPELGSVLKFTIKIQGDTMTQTGVGNPYTEVWKRMR